MSPGTDCSSSPGNKSLSPANKSYSPETVSPSPGNISSSPGTISISPASESPHSDWQTSDDDDDDDDEAHTPHHHCRTDKEKSRFIQEKVSCIFFMYEYLLVFLCQILFIILYIDIYSNH